MCLGLLIINPGFFVAWKWDELFSEGGDVVLESVKNIRL